MCKKSTITISLWYIIYIVKMNIKILGVLLLFVVFVSCKNTKDENPQSDDEENAKQDLSKVDISNLDYLEFTLDENTERVIENWQEYFELADIVANVKDGDLSFFKDNDSLINSLFKNLKVKNPDTIKTPSIRARIVALETKFRKLESFSNLSTTSNDELNSAIKEFLLSFSHLNLQMNKKMEDDSQNVQKP